MPSIAGRAPAKINLGLRILNLRPDGYHEIRTVFQTVSLADHLRVEYRSGGSGGVTLECDAAELAGTDNLAARAARALLSASGRGGSVHIGLRKSIPAGAGLGGGSSDAAAVLLALGRLLRPAPEPRLLLEVAAGLGSDIPFFLLGGRALGTGRGTEVYPLPDLPRTWLLILAPVQHVSTAEAYGALRRSRRGKLTDASRENIIREFCSGLSAPETGGTQDLAGVRLSTFENDFEDLIFQQFPDLGKWKNRLVQKGASRAMLSGSGSALVGLFPGKAGALRAKAGLAGFPGEIHLAHTLSRRAFQAIWRGRR